MNKSRGQTRGSVPTVKLIFLLLASCILLLASQAYAFTLYDDTNCQTHIEKTGGPCEDVKNTRHNLSSTGPGTTKTAQTTEICVFCHTPHGANTDALLFGAPIWNRKLSAATYTMYDQVWSKSFEGQLNSTQPTGFSRLCLSCHDGTIALGRVINPPGSGGFVPKLTAGESDSPYVVDPAIRTFTDISTMPAGAGATTGDTRLLGTDLRNDHAISFVFDSFLSRPAKDDELQLLTNFPGGINLGSGVSLTQPGVDADLTPLKRHVGSSSTLADSVQCTSCHNPHQVDFPKFLRANRLQTDFTGPGGGPPVVGNPTFPVRTPGVLPTGAIICVFCHDKPGVPYGKDDGTGSNTQADLLGFSKGLSTHFTDPTLLKNNATELGGTTADQLNLPPTTFPILNPTKTQPTVKERACLACHDPHTEQGSIRLLRAGADNSVDTTSYPSENSPTVAIEQTCYMCHSPTTELFNIIDAASCTANPSDCPPDVMTQFRKDFGTGGTTDTVCNGEVDDPDFCFPEAGLGRQYPAGETGIPGANGSAMNLRLGVGHQPVFTNLPREGVQLGDENPQGAPAPTFGGPLFIVPPGNKILPENAPNVTDTKHIECVDCHNMHRVNRSNRFRGMPGITIDQTDTSGSSALLVAQTLNNVLATNKREPYIFEVCLRCHGNSFNQHVKEQRVNANGTGLVVQLRGNNPVPTFSYTGPPLPNATSTVLGSGSNKRKEFDPNAKPYYDTTPATVGSTGQLRLNAATECGPTNPPGPNCNNGLPDFNTAFHPVARIGRNQSGVLNQYSTADQIPGQTALTPGGQLLGGLRRDCTGGPVPCGSTIQCTDCHNTNLFGTFSSSFTKASTATPPDFPGPITFDGTREADPNNVWKRSTDLALPRIWSGVAPYNANSLNNTTTLNDPTKPQGPHGSVWRRILRANFDTTLATTEGGPDTAYASQRFALCFNCHAEEAFQTANWNDPDDRLTNFYRSQAEGNLHAYHLGGMAKGSCHECHNNVHSNIESGNTLYIRINKANVACTDANAGIGDCNPGHENSTHLINFAPEIAGNAYPNPVWGAGNLVNLTDFNAGYRGPGCNLRCHGQDMVHNYDAHSVQNGEKCNFAGRGGGTEIPCDR